jgi:hypothetical protein
VHFPILPESLQDGCPLIRLDLRARCRLCRRLHRFWFWSSRTTIGWWKSAGAGPTKRRVQPQKDQAERPRKGREAAEQAEAARQNAEALEQQRAEQNARETAGRICIADEGGYLIDTWTKKSPAWGVCQDLCNHTPATGLPPPVDGAQDLGKRDRYCEKQCQTSDASGGRCYQIKPDQRATVLQALRQDWEVHEESQFLPGN